MKKGNMVKKVGQGLSVLALSILIGSGICYSKEVNSQGYKVPDLSNATFVKERYDDLTDKIEGKETQVEQYKLGNPERIVSKVSINEKVFLYGVSNHETGEIYAIADMDGDGIFETRYDEKDLTYTSKEKKDFPTKKELPPEWVLK